MEWSVALLEDKEQLKKLYIDEGVSCETIRKELRVGHKRVENALKEFEIPYRNISEACSLSCKKRGKWQGNDNPMINPETKEEAIKKALENRRSYKGKGGPMYGKHFSEESKAKMRAKKLKWYTPLYMQIRHSTKADQWSRDILKRDDYTCQECGKRGGYLEAHHIVGFKKLFEEFNIKSYDEAMNTPELWSLNNGITLCKKCHKETDNYGGRG